MNKLCPFTENQVSWFLRSLWSWFNIAEGGKRAGKNILAVQSFCSQLEDHPNKLHLVAGVSISTAKLNVLDCDGYGVRNYFEGRCHDGKYDNKEALFVQTKTGEKIILLAGGAKKNSYTFIKGNTYGMVMITEANECHKTFVQESFDRTLTSGRRRIFHDLNPKAPKHSYYTDVEEFHKLKQEEDSGYGFNYGHFTIADNLSINDQKLREILNTYDKDSLWYKRDMKGMRIIAEGLIYGRFAANEDAFIIDEIPERFGRGFITVGIDFGGNESGHAFNATLISMDHRNIITISDYWNDKDMDAEELASEFIRWIKPLVAEYKQFPIRACYADSAEQVLIRTLKSAIIKHKIPTTISNATKGLILNRIRFYRKIMALGVYKIKRNCTHTIDAFATALWAENDNQEDERLDDGTTNIDTLDSQEYSTEKHMNTIVQAVDIMKKGA